MPRPFVPRKFIKAKKYVKLFKMRDLAKTNFTSNRSSKAKFVIRIVFVLFLVLTVLSFVKSRFNLGQSGSSASVTLQEASRGLTPVKLDDLESIVEGGVNLATQTANLVDVKYGGRASGTATRSFGVGSYSLSVDVVIPETKGGIFEVWLVGAQGELREVDFISCKDNACSYNLKDKDKYSNYSRIWVTKELTKEDGEPEQHVLEGQW